MSNELELWQFIASHLERSESVMLLVVAKSSGSSPGRAGYKMAVAGDGELCGSIGGGIMEVNLVDQSRALLSEPGAIATGFRNATIKEQVHQKNSGDSSGMICSGRQTVILKRLDRNYLSEVLRAGDRDARLAITSEMFAIGPSTGETQSRPIDFKALPRHDFLYREKLGPKNELYIIGGGHCALALSELMSKMDFRISIFDDRPDLNTIEKNRFAHDIMIINGYENVGELMHSGSNVYVAVMTLGYKSDEVVIRSLFDKDFKYFGVLGSKAKMKTLLRDLEKEGFSKERLDLIHTPIGLAINSRTPDEIAVSVAAEIISIKNL